MPPASASAARTSAYGACSPLKVGQFGPVVGAGGGGGGGSSSLGGFAVGRGAGVVWRTGARVLLGVVVAVGVADGEALGDAVGDGVGVDDVLSELVCGGRNDTSSGPPSGVSIAHPRPIISTTTANALPTAKSERLVSLVSQCPASQRRIELPPPRGPHKTIPRAGVIVSLQNRGSVVKETSATSARGDKTPVGGRDRATGRMGSCRQRCTGGTCETSPSSPTWTTARRRWSTPCCARLGHCTRGARWPTASWTRWTSSGRRASRSSPRTRRSATDPPPATRSP